MATYTYTLKYSANGGSGTPSTQSYGGTSSTSHTFVISSSEPTRTGYSFRGWSKSSSATSASYSSGGSITLTSSDPLVTLYAVWRLRTYTVSYSANGGSGAPGDQTKTYGVTLTLSSTAPYKIGVHVSRLGNVLLRAACRTRRAGRIPLTHQLTRYAVWSENAPTTYTVYYNANGEAVRRQAKPKPTG